MESMPVVNFHSLGPCRSQRNHATRVIQTTCVSFHRWCPTHSDCIWKSSTHLNTRPPSSLISLASSTIPQRHRLPSSPLRNRRQRSRKATHCRQYFTQSPIWPVETCREISLSNESQKGDFHQFNAFIVKRVLEDRVENPGANKSERMGAHDAIAITILTTFEGKFVAFPPAQPYFTAKGFTCRLNGFIDGFGLILFGLLYVVFSHMHLLVGWPVHRQTGIGTIAANIAPFTTPVPTKQPTHSANPATPNPLHADVSRMWLWPSTTLETGLKSLRKPNIRENCERSRIHSAYPACVRKRQANR
jgi:hypothetical protein